MTDLTIHEIFTSLQGETTESGRPCTFVRLTACDLRCSWCDSPHAFTGGQKRSVNDVVADVLRRGIGFVTVTGGEPLLQPACAELVATLLDSGAEVQVETGGHRDITPLDRRARIILDLKAPDSGETGAMLWSNVPALRPHDQVKMVLASRADYEWAREVIRTRLDTFEGAILLQPAHGLINPAEIAEWMIEDRLPARLTIQLHVLLWPGRTGV